MKKGALLLLLSTVLCSCARNVDYDYVKSTKWLYASGFRVNDYMVFDKTGYYTLKGDTLMVQNKPRAILVSTNKRNYDLTIRSIDGKSEGHYEDTDSALGR